MSEVPELLESGNATEDGKTRKSLRSAVITENDQLKIKLKISKKDIGDGNRKKECAQEMKTNRSNRNNAMNETFGSEERNMDDDPKMRLRSKREGDEDGDQRNEDLVEGMDEKKKKISKSDPFNDSEDVLLDKPIVKKRGRPSKVQIEENERLEERRRLKRLEMLAGEGERNLEDHRFPKEAFCWTCHKDGSVVKCDTCPRVFHLKCVSLSKDPSKDWICPECSLVLHAEKMSTRSEAMKNLSLDQLCTLLNFAIGRMKNVPESEAFWKAVDPKEVPFYDKYITNPMDLNLLEKNMKARMYGSPQAFLADAKWLLHNSIIFNSTQSPLTSTARFLVKICRQEMAEIENCPDCYLNAHTKKEWFVEVCRKPHILIWARLKGFPFWPAKAMSTNLKTQSVDARFFGAHDKAWVPVKECYLYSKNSPQFISKKRADLDDAFLEADSYIKKIRQKYGTFCYAPDKTPFVPEMYDKQLQSMIPSFQEEKTPKKKKKRQIVEENGVMEKNVQTGKKLTEHGAQHRFKLKRLSSEETAKVSDDICFMNEYNVSEEKILSEDKISPEDEIARSLEMYDTGGKGDGEAVDENSTDLDEDTSVPIPEHGYSRSFDAENDLETVGHHDTDGDSVEIMREVSSNSDNLNKNGYESNNEDKLEIVESNNENSLVAMDKIEESDSEVKIQEVPQVPGGPKNVADNDWEKDQCIVSSTSADVTVDNFSNKDENQSVSSEAVTGKRKSIEALREEPSKKFQVLDIGVEAIPDGPARKEDDRSMKSFTNLTLDQRQKILTEAKLLANIDEMTALGKQKILNELGLDVSLVDIRQLAQENRQILETLNKKGHSDSQDGRTSNELREIEDIAIKNEDLEQYLLEEDNQDVECVDSGREDPTPPPQPRLGSIKVRDIQSLSKSRNCLPNKDSCESAPLKIMDVKSLKDGKSIKKDQSKLTAKKKSADDPKKLKLEPVIELIKLDVYDKSIQKLNRKLRLSDEVSLLMVDGEKKTSFDAGSDVTGKKLPVKKLDRPPRARKSMPNRTRQRANLSNEVSSSKSSPKNISVISVDTENSNAQKNLLKSLCSEERKPEEDASGNKKTVLITTNDKGIRNVDVTTDEEVSRNLHEVTIENLGKSSDGPKDGISLNQQKNLTLVANSHLILTNNGPTFLTNQSNQGNLALTQNNLGQLSLVHLTNLTSGIQTNFVNLTNETIGLNNSIGTIYASPNFAGDASSYSAGNLILSSAPATTSLTCSAGGNTATSNKSLKGVSEVGSKAPVHKTYSNRQISGISVKSPASLGLVATPSSKTPPVVTKPLEEGFGSEVGSVTAELNRHSIKMAEYMRATIEDILRELSNQGSLEAKYKSLTIEMEKLQWKHQQEIMELKNHSERSLMELRTSLESEKQKCLAELKSQLEARHQKIISETKSKQWCANCGKEALFYCCWNTSYCDYPCQQQHWPGHMSRCAQLGNNIQGSSQLQNKNAGLKYQNMSYVPIISRAGGSHSTGSLSSSSRSASNVQK